MDRQTIKTAYYDTIYSVTKAILAPVVDAVSDSISEAVKRGTEEALQNINPVNMLDLFLRKKK